jgi:hypothetical protein
VKCGELRLSPAYNFVGFDIETQRGKDKQLDNFEITGMLGIFLGKTQLYPGCFLSLFR